MTDPFRAAGFLLAAAALAAPIRQAAAEEPVAAARPALVPVATYAESPFLVRPVLSPDGRSIAAHVKSGDATDIVVFAVDGAPGAKKRVPLGKVGVAALRWAGPNRLLLTTRSTASFYGQEVPVQRLVAVDLDAAGRARVLDRYSDGLVAGDVLHVAPGGDWILVASQNDLYSTPSVKRIDLTTDKVVTVEKSRPDVWDWYADGKGVVRAGVAYQGERWTVWYREQADAPLRAVRGKVARDEEGTVDGLRFMTGADTGLIITNARTGRFAAYRYDFRTGAVGEPIYEHGEVDVASVVVDSAGGDVLGVAYTDDRYRVHWIDPAMRTQQARIDKALPDRENIVIGTSDDANRVLLWSGGASDPGVFYLFDRAKRTMSPIASPYEKLGFAPHAAVSPVRYQARDGLSIPGYLTLPPGRDPKDLPLIVLPHGGPHARDAWDFDPWVQFLANRGYAVLQPNFRGSTGYGKAFVERGYGQWGRAMQDDVDDGVDWLVKSGRVDPKRVCIMGASYGGYAALWGAIRNPDRYRCAVSFAGVTDLRGMLRHDRKSFAAPRYYRMWETKVRGTEKTDLDGVSPLQQAAQLRIPVFVSHGDKDDNVPARQGRQMVEALRRAGHPALESAFYADEGHGLDRPANKEDFLRRLEAFLAKHNPA